MSLALRHSIKEVTRVFVSRNSPVQVTADDVQDYVAKHNHGLAPCITLRNELLAHGYAKLWGLPVLDAALLTVEPAHVGRHAKPYCKPEFFTQTCFATRFVKESTEFYAFQDQTSYYESKRFHNRNDLLKIVLFDIWLANNDRSGGHPNLLVTADEEGHTIRVMDHEGIFNMLDLDRELPLLKLDDTLLTHPAMRALLGKDFNKEATLVQQLVADLYLWAEACEQHTNEILSDLPADWQIDPATFESLLKRQIFSEEWLRTVCRHFHLLLKQC